MIRPPLHTPSHAARRPLGSRSNPLQVAAAIALTSLASASAQDAVPYKLDTVIVEAESSELVQEPFLPEVQGVKINSGKKSSVIDLDAFPQITNNNYRQALAKTP